ncbi:hypothetical protein SUDANB176_07328 [Streptomyces sp. enrichment culture]|uniref:hypothetical protein n=1 Tax=Streptomyces sp. enrichment culture TaxID=1795815 RepID=UPI003F54FE53
MPPFEGGTVSRRRAEDALGRLTTPPTAAPGLPEGLREATTGLTLHRLTEAFGSPERAREILDGRIACFQQQPAPAHRAEETPTELALLQTARAPWTHT